MTSSSGISIVTKGLLRESPHRASRSGFPYQTLQAITKLPSPGELSSERPDFATPRDGLIVALGAWWRKHVGREPSANNKDAPFVRLCRYAMTDKQLSYATVNKALKNTPKLAEKFEKLRREAESWEHDPF